MSGTVTDRIKAAQAYEHRKDVAGGYLVGTWDGTAMAFNPAPVIESVQEDPTGHPEDEEPLIAVTIWTGHRMSVLMVERDVELVIEYR